MTVLLFIKHPEIVDSCVTPANIDKTITENNALNDN